MHNLSEIGQVVLDKERAFKFFFKNTIVLSNRHYLDPLSEEHSHSFEQIEEAKGVAL